MFLGTSITSKPATLQKQTLIGLDGLMDMVELKKDGPLREMAREIKERACLFMEENR